MNPNPQNTPPMQPGRALNWLLFVAFMTWLSYRWASTPGWEPAWLFVAVFALATFRAAVDLRQAHRNWKIRHALEEEAQTMRRRGTRPSPNEFGGGRDRWR